MKRTHQILAILGATLYFLAGYFLISRHVTENSVLHSLALPGEETIPFIPWSIIIYVSAYLMVPASFLLLRSDQQVKMFWAFMLGLAIHQIFWFFYPVEYLFRPIIVNPQTNLLKFLAAFYQLDSPPLNSFPSLHVTSVFLSYFAVSISRPRLAPFFLVMAILISISTVTVKQHYIADAVAGFLVAFVLRMAFLKMPQTRESHVTHY